MRIIDDVRQAANSAKVFCTNCGAVNPAGQADCSECGNPLDQPTSMLNNAIGVIAWPQRSLRRVVTTAPVMQAFLIVLFSSALVLIIQYIGVLVQLNQIVSDPSPLRDEIYVLKVLRIPLSNLGYQNVPPANVVDLLSNPTPGTFDVIAQVFQSLLTWIIFSGVVYLLTRLFYKKEALPNFAGVLALVGIARITWISFLITLPLLSNQDLSQYGQILILVAAIWQLALLVAGVRVGLKMTWNHSLTVVLLPAVAIVFIFGISAVMLFT